MASLSHVLEVSLTSFPASLSSLSSLSSVQRILFDADPFEGALFIVLFFSAFCFVVSNVTGSMSQVDKLWSILPPLYTWFFWFRSNSESEDDKRSLVMAVLATLWGVRLTFNFARKGGYTGEEDYRWPIIRKDYITNPFLWMIFNITFICLYQNLLLMLQVCSAYVVCLQSPNNHDNKLIGGGLSTLDWIATSLFLFFLIMESVADQQQWNFHQLKARAKKETNLIKDPKFPDLKRGFLTTGLFSLSRHPNFFAEQAMWWSFALFGCSLSEGLQGLIGWALIGPFLLTLLFLGSAPFTELITSSKYPKYKEYQQSTSRQIPWFPAKQATKLD